MTLDPMRARVEKNSPLTGGNALLRMPPRLRSTRMERPSRLAGGAAARARPRRPGRSGRGLPPLGMGGRRAERRRGGAVRRLRLRPGRRRPAPVESRRGGALPVRLVSEEGPSRGRGGPDHPRRPPGLDSLRRRPGWLSSSSRRGDARGGRPFRARVSGSHPGPDPVRAGQGGDACDDGGGRRSGGSSGGAILDRVVQRPWTAPDPLSGIGREMFTPTDPPRTLREPASSSVLAPGASPRCAPP
jgi:hypothetical protein